VSDLLNRHGKLSTDIYSLSEVMIRDSRLLGVLYYDEFSMRVCKSIPLRTAFNDRCAPDTTSGLIENDDLALIVWLKKEYGMDCRLTDAKPILNRWAAVSRNPVAEALGDFLSKYDGKPRLETMFVDYFGVVPESAEHAYYLAEIGKRFMVGAVARKLKPAPH
jgi:predicted P-loop ATPase